MAATALPDWPPLLEPEQQHALSNAAVDYALSHSIVYRPLPQEKDAGPPLNAAIHAPISLLPSPFPAQLFHQSQALQPLYNDLYARITLDEHFLRNVIGGNVILVDEFQAKLWQIWNTVRQEGLAQTLHLGLFRSDYLLHQEDEGGALSIKQVELNTISSSFGPLCSRVSEMHRHILRSTQYYGASPLLHVDRLPVNKALETLANGLAAGHRAYIDRMQTSEQVRPPVLLFVVQDNERNAFDQRLIEYALMERHDIIVVRASLTQLAKHAKLQEHNQALLYTDPATKRTEHISVVYFRAGYGPSDYTSHREWDARLLLERSKAIKCPSTALQLAGAKKVQQVLSNAGVLESLVQDERRGRVWTAEEVERIRASFMPMYGMESDSEGVTIASDVQRASAYVLKPQREGGGNNVYRQDIVAAMQQLEQQDAADEESADARVTTSIKRREAYILMKLIEPPQNVGNYIVRHTSPTSASTPSSLQASVPTAVLAHKVISELGAFGTILFEADPTSTVDPSAIAKTNVVFEQSGGHLLRTKARDSNEGGVAAGFSVIDSPLLV